jgi:GNAT superfamily N-acetyltransferase
MIYLFCYSVFAGDLYMESDILIRPYMAWDETAFSQLIADTMKISNRKDYSPEYIERIIQGYSPEFFIEQAKETHFYAAVDCCKIIGCGGVTMYHGSTDQSYLLAVFVLPEYQGQGIGKLIVEALEEDEYSIRARRIELSSSITASGFYRQLGYESVDGLSEPDENGVIRMEKRRQIQ